MEQWKLEQVALAGYSYRVENDEFVFIDDTPTQSELDTIFEEYNSQEYARNRSTEYPAIKDQLDEIYHNGIDSWKALIKVTKDKYPKG
jgi:hypothetical protein